MTCSSRRQAVQLRLPAVFAGPCPARGGHRRGRHCRDPRSGRGCRGCGKRRVPAPPPAWSCIAASMPVRRCCTSRSARICTWSARGTQAEVERALAAAATLPSSRSPPTGLRPAPSSAAISAYDAGRAHYTCGLVASAPFARSCSRRIRCSCPSTSSASSRRRGRRLRHEALPLSRAPHRALASARRAAGTLDVAAVEAFCATPGPGHLTRPAWGFDCRGRITDSMSIPRTSGAYESTLRASISAAPM